MNRYFQLFTAQFSLLVLILTFAHAKPLALVKDGKPNATIVLQAKAPQPVATAAQDLQKCIQRITGVTLPLVNDGQPTDGITLHVGKTAATLATDLPSAKLNPESYSIKVRGNAIYFNGRYPSPTAFAVYSFLQDQLGVRWFAPGDDWEYVPLNKTPGNFVVDAKSIVSVPDTSPRIWSGHAWTDSWAAWNLRNKTVQSEVVPRRNFQNNMYRIFPPSKYAKTHPEYYPLVNGKRWIPPSDSYRLWWPSVGNEDVQRITVEYIRKYFNDNPRQDSFSLGMDDIIYMCGDAKSRAMDSSPADYANRRFSDRFYKFINIIAREVKKTHPDKYIGVLIYSIARFLPNDVPKLEDNVFGYITENSALWYDPELKQTDQELTRAWAKRVKHLSRYDYYGLGTFVPRVYPHTMAEQLKFDKSLGFEGMYTEVYTFLPHTAPMIWAFAQMQWRHEQDVDGLLDEFYDKMFGTAAPTMKKYFQLLEGSWNTPRPGHRGWVFRNIARQAVSISPEAARNGMELLGEAEKETSVALEQKRIGIIKAGLKYANYAVLGYADAKAISSLPIQNAADARKAIDELKRLGALIGERNVYWQEAFQRQDLLGENLRGLTEKMRRPILQTDAQVLDTPAVSGILNLLQWSQLHSPGQLHQTIQEISNALPNQAVAQSLHDWLWVQQNKPLNLLINSDFEAKNDKDAPVPGTDWQTVGVPTGWSTWSRYGHAQLSPTEGRKNRPALILKSEYSPRGPNAVSFIQNIDLKNQQNIFASGWVKTLSETNSSFNLRFRNESGWVGDSSSDVQIIVPPGPDWQPVMVSARVPADATSVAFILGVTDGATAFTELEVNATPVAK